MPKYPRQEHGGSQVRQGFQRSQKSGCQGKLVENL